jgi:hypothetical protein
MTESAEATPPKPFSTNRMVYGEVICVGLVDVSNSLGAIGMRQVFMLKA